MSKKIASDWKTMSFKFIPFRLCWLSFFASLGLRQNTCLSILELRLLILYYYITTHCGNMQNILNSGNQSSADLHFEDI